MSENNRKSWREIDKMRDRSAHTGGARRSNKSELERALENPRLKKMYLQEAEKLFQGPQGKPEHAKALERLQESYGTKSFDSVVREYVDEYGLPQDWGTLLMLLDLREQTDILCDAMEEAWKMGKTKGPVERKGLESKIRFLSMTAKDPDVGETAESLLAESS